MRAVTERDMISRSVEGGGKKEEELMNVKQDTSEKYPDHARGVIG
jgi:hypothetical protein